jgi:uncharacterized membrane protein YdbT with pleckstrin-like domain
MDYLKSLLAANEEVVFRTRRHWFVLFGATFKEFLLLVSFVVAGIFLTPVAPWAWMAFSAMGMLVFISMLLDFLRWRNQEFLVTNRRVIHSSGVVNKSIIDSSLTKINDVILTQTWMGRMFNYGTIKILTATEEVINLLDHIRKPIELKRAMMDAKAGLETYPAATIAAPQATATQLLDELASLRTRSMITEEEYQEKRKEILRRM